LLTSANFEVFEAEDGEAGLAAAAAHRPDLILMDIQLPGLDGYEATRRLKADAVLQAIPVIAVTAHALSGLRTRRAPRVAMPILLSQSARARSLQKSVSICPPRRGD
jgi:CheY-like chemotaxis protein